MKAQRASWWMTAIAFALAGCGGEANGGDSHEALIPTATIPIPEHVGRAQQAASTVTRFYLPSTGTAAVNPAADSAHWANYNGGNWDRRPLVPSFAKGVSAQEDKGLAETSATKLNTLIRQYVSPPLTAQTILKTGTLQGQIRARESNASANFRTHLVVKVVSGDGATVRGVLYVSPTVAATATPPELVVSSTALAGTSRKTPQGGAVVLTTATDVAAQAGDRLVVELGFYADNTVTTSYTGTLIFGEPATDLTANDDTVTAGNAPWIQFSQALSIARCGDGVIDPGEQCDNTAGCCDLATCQWKATGATCGSGPAVCSAQDTCDASHVCLPNHLPSSTVCRAKNEDLPCDIPEVCTGSTDTCPADALTPGCAAGCVCTGTGTLDLLTGSANENWYIATADVANNTGIRNILGSVEVRGTAVIGGACGGAAACRSTFCADGLCCNTACDGGACDACNAPAGWSATAGTCAFAPAAANVVCRAAVGECDLAAQCAGGTATCPANPNKAAGVACTDTTTTDCYDARCNGAGACSQTQAFETAAYVCRAAAGGTCDVAESCNGSSGACPADLAGNAGSVCRPAAGPCDLEDRCDGATMACPDLLVSAGTRCDGAGTTCNGSVANCGANAGYGSCQ